MESGQILRLNEFFVEGDNQELSHVLLHIIQPSTPEEDRDKGYFFAICEINHGSKDDIYHLQRIIDEIETGYYESGDNKNKSSLEVILEKINQDNSAVFAAGFSLNCVIGAICKNEITFAYHGKPEILLFYKNKDGLYQKMELISTDEESDTDANKIFPQIVKGKINPNDYLFVGTARIHDYFNHDRLQKIITARSPEKSAEHLEKVLSEIRNGLSFGGLILNITKKITNQIQNETNVTGQTDKTSSPKINPLFLTEQNTARTLSPSLFPKIKIKIKSLINTYRENQISPSQTESETTEKNFSTTTQITSNHLRPHKSTMTKSRAEIERIEKWSMVWLYIQTIFRYIGLGIWKILTCVGHLLYAIGKNFIMLVIVAVNFKNRRREIIDEWLKKYNDVKNTFKQLPLLTKILAVTALTVAIIFGISLLYLQINQKRIAENQHYQDTLQLIKNQTDAADSAMIYGDLNTALKEADGARTALIEFICRPKDKDICTQINDRINTLMASARKMYPVTPQILVDWGEFGYTNVNKLLKITSKLIGLSSNSSTICIYNLLNQENKFSKSPDKQTDGFTVAATPKENDYALLIYNKKNAMIYNPQDNSLKKAEINTPNADTDIIGGIIYNRRLYSLDATNNQIYRHDNIKDGFDMGKNWLKETSLNIRDTSSMAVDGDLYVLKTNGEIYKFSQSYRTAFDLQGVDPALSSGTAIRTYTDWKNIYILDNVEKRIIIVDTTGKLIKQLVLQNLKNPSDMMVEESTDTAYVLDDNKLYQVNLK
ncbi:MAG: hypothetical protein COU29_02925 [Candidatus Magasanikbacteria bacterium CG10_big_fil_rev_8_21_14_0_10_36_32]|uniref:PPM-type phosphatase domain-containing protein n=1 Tax=Candidatus Magasanikbacteria bacterium CG10_big_fil_rev_8_21_14_0_10_36_32 TaxID=1974646 RepID=A0A2M6W628_9BACT|nr:MAG: hypothetical protein COU29_02925 [Candidatus Magasanikbacteria bacterium CG10_big_fil_rev_8_21_14_0_10_36_32]